MTTQLPTAAVAEPPSYWSIVWGQFRKNITGVVAVYIIIALLVLAVIAPLIASKVPLIWVSESGRLSFPLLHALLFNRNIYENGVDIFFNLFLLAAPFIWLANRLFVRAIKGQEVTRRRAAESNFQMGIAVLLLVIFAGLMAIDPRSPTLDYRLLAGSSDRFYLFPPLRIQFDDTLYGAEGPGIRHLLGQDGAGRDIFVRLLFGTRVSLAVGVIAVSIYVTIGTILGALAGFFGGIWDLIVSRLIELLLCFPSFFLILTFIGFLEQPSIFWVMVIIGFTGWTGPARLVRAEFLRLRNLDFVTAARAAGLTNTRIIFRHVLPNALGPILVTATFGVASSVIVESSLSFLGFGDPTLPSWGRILSYGRDTSDEAMMLIAGVAIFVTVSAFNLAGEGLRDALDPRLRK
jgi:peptide/nickel transport system permease protein